MIGVVCAILSSVGYGVSNVVSATAVHRFSTASLALWAQLVGLTILSVAVVVRRPDATVTGVGWGAAAGAVAALAVLSFYTALQRGSATVVGPVSGCGVVIPVLAGVLGGESIGLMAGGGLVASFVGVVIVASAKPGRDGGDDQRQIRTVRRGPKQAADVRLAPSLPLAASPGWCRPIPTGDSCVPAPGAGSARSSVLLAAVAAVLFGLFFLGLDRATAATGAAAEISELDASLPVALALQLGAFTVTLIVARRHRRACLMPGRALMLPATAVGLLDVGSDLLLIFAVARGPLAVVGPLGSLAPLVTVLIAVTVLRQRVRPLQAGGIAMTLLGIGLIVSG